MTSPKYWNPSNGEQLLNNVKENTCPAIHAIIVTGRYSQCEYINYNAWSTCLQCSRNTILEFNYCGGGYNVLNMFSASPCMKATSQ